VRIVGSVSLVIAATPFGLFGALMLGVSGLTMAGPGLTIIEYSDADDSERSLGIRMGLFALVAWLLLLLSGALVGLRGDPSRRTRRTSIRVVIAVSAVLVLGLTIAVLSIPPAPSEYPLPGWNRA
jgi:hypothetical protein